MENSKQQLIKDLRELADLLEFPEPGIASWHLTCDRIATRIEEEFRRAKSMGK